MSALYPGLLLLCGRSRVGGFGVRGVVDCPILAPPGFSFSEDVPWATGSLMRARCGFQGRFPGGRTPTSLI